MNIGVQIGEAYYEHMLPAPINHSPIMPSKVQLTPADCAATALKQQNNHQGAILFLKECHREEIIDAKVRGCYQDGFIAYLPFTQFRWLIFYHFSQ